MCALKVIRELCQAGTAAQAAGDMLNADFFLHQAYARAKGLHSPVLEAKILNTMAVFAMADRRPGQAVPLLSEARDKVCARLGMDSKLYGIIEGNLRRAQGAAIEQSAS